MSDVPADLSVREQEPQTLEDLLNKIKTYLPNSDLSLIQKAYEFSEKFPFRRIQIKPVDEKRRKLYNHVFRRNYEVINVHFQIVGINGRKRENYSPNNYYQRFEINRKFE